MTSSPGHQVSNPQARSTVWRDFIFQAKAVADPRFWSGGPSGVLTTGGGAEPKIGVFPLKLSENCMILRVRGAGPPGPLDPLVEEQTLVQRETSFRLEASKPKKVLRWIWQVPRFTQWQKLPSKNTNTWGTAVRADTSTWSHLSSRHSCTPDVQQSLGEGGINWVFRSLLWSSQPKQKHGGTKHKV